ncbi:20530_t:CDS:1, partial [Cetraspora pellucida]
VFAEDPHNYWIPSGIMAEFTTSIYKENTLLPEEHQTLLQSYPQNKTIKFNPLPMDKQIINRMSKHAQDTDKTFSKLAYRFSSSLCLLDLAIKHLYEVKPQNEDQSNLSWKYLEEALLLQSYLHWTPCLHSTKYEEMKHLSHLFLTTSPALKMKQFSEQNCKTLSKKRIEKQSFSTMHYINEGGKKNWNVRLYPAFRTTVAQDLVNINHHDTAENFQDPGRETFTGAVFRQIAQTNNKHKGSWKRFEESLSRMAKIFNTTLGYVNYQRWLLFHLGTCTPTKNLHPFWQPMKSQYTTRSFKVVRPESDMRIPYQQTLFHVEYFFSSEKSWCSQISNRFMRTKQLYLLYAFQNRRLGPHKSINTAQRLYDIDRYQRGLSP